MLKLWSLPKVKDFYGKIMCLSLWPTYIGEKRRTLGKTQRIKVKCYWEHPWGTYWEPDGNKIKMNKILPSLQNLKEN
jgi:hypothetical protein